MTNGGSEGNVFWQVCSSATLGTGTSFAGNILAMASITVTTGVRVTGRTLAMNGAVTLDTNAVTATNLLASAVTTSVGGALTTGSGASFWDVGTLSARLQADLGIRGLSAADASLAWANPSLLAVGDLNLLGLANPLASLEPKSLLYGAVAGWTTDISIAWGTSIEDPHGVALVWGTSEALALVWGTWGGGDALVWGTRGGGDALVWGTAILTSPNSR
jgi:hypothetical protein